MIVINFDAKITTKVVAGAHNIHSILPEDTIQKRKVVDMWKVIEFIMWKVPEENQIEIRIMIDCMMHLYSTRDTTRASSPTTSLFLNWTSL